MTLAELLEKQFRPDLRFRGAGYLKAERVALRRITPDRVYGVVRDGVDFETQLDRSEGKFRKHCSCEQFAKLGVCKHIWATILAVDEQKILTAAPRPGYYPPFMADDESAGFSLTYAADEEADDDLPVSVMARGKVVSSPGSKVTLARQANVPTAAPATAARRPWEQALHSLRSDLADSRTSSAGESREREVFYEIDLPASQRANQLVIQVSQRQRRATGQWGKLKPLKMRPGRFDELDLEDDRTILSFLYGGAPDRSDNTLKTEAPPAVFRYTLPQELCERLLPIICRTNRLRYLNAREKQATSLGWDTGEPWELALKFSPQGLSESTKTTFSEKEKSDRKKSAGEENGAAVNDDWRLTSQIVRNGEVMPPESVQLLVPGGLVLTETTIGRLHDYHAFGWVKLLGEGTPIQVPADEKEELVDRLLDMPTLPRLVLPDELRLEEVQIVPAKVLVIESPGTDRLRHFERLLGYVRFDYDGAVVSGTSDRWGVVQRDRGRCILRDRPAEDAAWAELRDCGFRRLLQTNEGGAEVEVSFRDLGTAVRSLVDCGWQVTADGSPIRRPADVAFRVKSGIDWFELHGDVEFDGQIAPFPELLAALARGETTVRLADGSWGIIPAEWAEKFGLLAGLGTAEEGHLRFELNQVSLLDALLSVQNEVELDSRFSELAEKFRNFSGIGPAAEPASFKGSLRTYQKEGLGWLTFLREFRLGGCLADDMGLGKTVQLLALLRSAKDEDQGGGPSLIVVPKSLLFNWKNECERFTPDMRVIEYTGSERAEMRTDFSEADLVLTTYGTLRRDISHLKDTTFRYVVLDEAQAIKNSGSQVAKAARVIKGRFRVALSGTPIENHLGDLWSIFEFLNPGMLGRSSLFRSTTSDTTDGGEGRKLLAQAMRPFILRRTKRQVAADLPDKMEETIYCDMGEKQKELYAELRDHYRQSLLGLVRTEGMAKSRMHVLEALLRLRQAACHPALLDHGGPMEASAKLDSLVPQLKELLEEGHKALVFSQFTSMLSIVRQHLDDAGIRYEYLDGQTRDRKQRVDRFQADEECGVFLISLKAGGLGLNLTAADYVFLLDPWWNPAVEAQAIDRAHRIGQKRQVFAYRLIVRDTVEEKIADLQKKKRALADGILEADAGSLTDLSTDDLELLLS